MKRRICTAMVIAATLGALTAVAGPTAQAGEMAGKCKVGDRAPDFTLADVEGRKVQLSKVNSGKVVLLAFWSLRCGACLKEVPYLEQLHKGFAGKGVAVVSVVIDGMDANATKSAMKDVDASPSYPVLLDLDFTVSDTYTNFVVPLTLVIDRKGIVRYVHTGFEPGEEKQYEAALVKALGS